MRWRRRHALAATRHYFFPVSGFPLPSFAPSITSSAVYIFILVSILALIMTLSPTFRSVLLAGLSSFMYLVVFSSMTISDLPSLHFDRDDIRLDRRDGSHQMSCSTLRENEARKKE